MFVRYKHLANATFKMGVCVPSKCSLEDVNSILSSESLKSAGKITVSYCKQKGEEQTSAEQTILLCIFGFVLGCIILGTTADVFLRIRGEDPNEKSQSIKNDYLRKIIRNTSLYNNALDVLDTSTCQESMRCLCGIRPIIVILIIYSHTYGHLHLLHFQKFSKAANFLRFFESFTFSGIANGSVAIDSVSFIVGVTLTYNRWRFVSEKSKVNLNICKLLLKRYCRMTAAQLLTICIFLLLPLAGSGPFWGAYMDPMLENCRKRWWLNVLYIDNYWESKNICLYHTWVLALIMQLTLLSVVILWLLKKSMRYGIFLMLILIISGIVGVAVMTVINELPGSLAFFMLDVRTAQITWKDVYTLPYDHMGPLCIGLLIGYVMALKKDKLQIGRATSAALWCSTLACNIAVMFGLYSYRHGEKMDLSLSTFYAIMHRNVWAVGIGWIIVACVTRHAGAVSRVLHSKFFVPLDRLCYMAYLMHIPIMYYHSGVIRERWFMGHTELLFLAIGYVVLSFFSSFVLHIIFVKPYYAVEEQIYSCIRCKDKVTFKSKADLKHVAENNTCVIPDEEPSTNECVNTAYSKNLDGV